MEIDEIAHRGVRLDDRAIFEISYPDVWHLC